MFHYYEHVDPFSGATFTTPTGCRTCQRASGGIRGVRFPPKVLSILRVLLRTTLAVARTERGLTAVQPQSGRLICSETNTV